MSAHFLRLVIPEPGKGTQPPPCTKRDPELFFPLSYTEGYERQIKEAKAVCRKCPLIASCLEFALETSDRHAILAATTPAEREAIRQRRHRKAEREAKRNYQKWNVEAA